MEAFRPTLVKKNHQNGERTKKERLIYRKKNSFTALRLCTNDALSLLTMLLDKCQTKSFEDMII